MTTAIEHTRDTVRHLSRPQLTALVKAAQQRDQDQMNLIEDSWDHFAAINPELAEAFDELSAAGRREDLARFEGFNRDDDLASKRLRTGPAGSVPVGLTMAGVLLMATAALTTLMGITPLLWFLASMAAAVSLIVGAGFLTLWIDKRHGIEKLFHDPAMSAEHVWVAATDTAFALALSAGMTPDEPTRQHLERLTSIWTEAGLSLDMLQPPATYRLAA